MTRQAVYDAMDRDGLFAAQVHDALEGLTDHMEASVYERGLTKSDTLALAWLRAKRPQEWGDKRTVEHNTTLNIHAVRELRQTFTVEELRALRDQTTEPESSQDGE
ncbi:MAG: hypothetical protein GWN58_15530 [Anaerolineae bacterium]|nr:hypothetical protein [Anaerolineae bacterium]